VEALQELRKQRTEILQMRAILAGTLEEVLPRYYIAKGNDAKATRLAREVILDGFKDWCGNPRVNDIDGILIDEWRKELSEKGGKRGKPVSLATLKSYTITLRAFLNWAREQGILRVDPLAKMKRQMRVTTTRVQGFLTEEDREKLLAADAPDYVRLILMLGFFAGLRDGEMLALNPKWLWISKDRSHGTLTVQNTPIKFTNGKTGEWQPKGRKNRKIPLHPRVIEFLKGYGMKEPWLLAPEKVEWPGEEMNAKRFDAKKALQGVAKRAGVKKLTFHMMRHSFATHLVMKGVTLADVAGLLGDSLRVTEVHYAGFCPGKANPLEVL
jgi:integrase